MEQTNEMSNHQLVDFDWSIKGIFGTSLIIAQSPPPLVEVNFHVCINSKFDKKRGNIKETLNLELNKQELKTLISSLDKSVNK